MLVNLGVIKKLVLWCPARGLFLVGPVWKRLGHIEVKLWFLIENRMVAGALRIGAADGEGGIEK